MDCLLIGGAPSVGKSEAIYRLTGRLLTLHGFRIIAGNYPPSFNDFGVVIERQINGTNSKKIIINSATDTLDIINDFKKFYDQNGAYYNILISSIRDDNFWPRQDFFRVMNISPLQNYILEIPLAKITRRGQNFWTALNWYYLQIDNLLDNTLNNNPFNV